MDYRLIRSRRKSISLQIQPDATLVIRAPFYMPGFMIDRLLKKKADWVLSKQRFFKKNTIPPRKYKSGEVFFYLGKEYQLALAELNETLVFDGTFKLSTIHRLPQEAFYEWYKEQTTRIITARVVHFSKQMEVRYQACKITRANRTWGSCTAKKRLNFSWRLSMAPREVIDYVVIHELAHLRHMNHSWRFWEEVATYCPDYKALRSWLRINDSRMKL